MKIGNRIQKMMIMVLVGMMSVGQSLPSIWAEGTAAQPAQQDQNAFATQPVIAPDQVVVADSGESTPTQDSSTEFLQEKSAIQRIKTVENLDSQTGNELIQEVDAEEYILKEVRPDGTVLTFDWKNKTAWVQVPGKDAVGYVDIDRAKMSWEECSGDKCLMMTVDFMLPEGVNEITSYRVGSTTYSVLGRPFYISPLVEDMPFVENYKPVEPQLIDGLNAPAPPGPTQMVNVTPVNVEKFLTNQTHFSVLNGTEVQVSTLGGKWKKKRGRVHLNNG